MCRYDSLGNLTLAAQLKKCYFVPVATKPGLAWWPAWPGLVASVARPGGQLAKFAAPSHFTALHRDMSVFFLQFEYIDIKEIIKILQLLYKKCQYWIS